MAGSITSTITLAVENGSYNPPTISQTQTQTQTGQGIISSIQEIGTSAEAIAYGDLSSCGVAFFKNLDTTNYVQLGPDSSGTQVTMLRIGPGEWSGPMSLEPGTTLKATANTGACKLWFQICQE